jgi:hypothetical protein
MEKEAIRVPLTLERYVKKAARQAPVPLVTGARQVGKTTLLRRAREAARVPKRRGPVRLFVRYHRYNMHSSYLWGHHMNFNVYIDKETGDRLERLAKTRRTSRNALVREALALLLERGAKVGWPPEVLDFQGIPAARPFEAARRKLHAPRKDPLA